MDVGLRTDSDVSSHFQIRNLDSGKELDFSQENNPYFTSALAALTERDPRSLTEFCSSRRQSNASLIRAVQAHDLPACKDLLTSSPPSLLPQLNAKDGRGWTPLHYAASLGFVDILKYIIETETVLDVNPRNCQERTPLHLAAMGDWTEAVGLLLEAGANPNVSDCDLMTPLHYSIDNSNADISYQLLSHSADPSLRNTTGQTPIQLLKSASPKLKSLLDESLGSIDTHDCSLDVVDSEWKKDRSAPQSDMCSPVLVL